MLADKRLKERYAVQRYPLASTGMAEVWPARDELLDRDVVIKAINPAAMDADLLRRFRREALLTARLDHPGVPAVYDLGEHNGYPYLVLQRITGPNLEDLTAENGPVPVAWAAAIGTQISSVLIAAERIGLIHRDIKPSNIILEPSGAVKVLDFGLAAMYGDKRYSRITRTGQSLGTVGYMAPEQVRSEPTDHRADLYGLGGTLYHLLTEEEPFDDDTTLATLERQLLSPPPRPSQRRADVPSALDDLVHALLAERPDDRPGSAAVVYTTLARHVTALPPIPGVVRGGLDPVRAYAAAVAQQPVHAPAQPNAGDHPVEFDPDAAAQQAELLVGRGAHREAARLWRQVAQHHEREHGPAHPLVIDHLARAARAHMALGENGRALRLVETLEERAGTEHPALLRLRRELEGRS